MITLASSQHNLYDLYLLLCVQCWTLADGQRYFPKHVESYSKNKFEKLVLLVDFIIRTNVVKCSVYSVLNLLSKDISCLLNHLTVIIFYDFRWRFKPLVYSIYLVAVFYFCPFICHTKKSKLYWIPRFCLMTLKCIAFLNVFSCILADMDQGNPAV